MKIQLAESDDSILKCWKAFKLLRPHLVEHEYLTLIKEMKSEGYLVAFIEQDSIAASVVGFRYLQYLFNGKHIYIDDLSTLQEYRGKGYGGMLLDFVFDYAKKLGFETVTLDSGHHRADAHRLYLNKGFTISSHHFTKQLNESQ